MTIDRRSMPSRDPQTGLEDLLREFYAAEMPVELRRFAEPTVAASTEISRQPAEGRSGRRFSLTAMTATLLLAASAFVLMPHVVSRTGRSGSDSGTVRSDAHPRSNIATESHGGSVRGPVELQGAQGGSVPASAAGNDADDQFPEFDIRILPIEGGRR